jgi:hypothetical protein
MSREIENTKKKVLYNKSKTYLLPLISEVLDLNIKFLPYLINTYLFDENNEYENCIFILHEFNFKNPEFTKYEHKLTNNELFVKHIDIDDKVVYIFKFPEEYLNEYNCLLNSQYSKFGDDAKQLILRFWGEVYSGNSVGVAFLLKIKQILYKEIKLKERLQKELGVIISNDQELGDYVDPYNEVFNSEDFKEIKIIN